jgi:hypothetical protein
MEGSVLEGHSLLKVDVGLPVSFTSALILHGRSCTPLPLVKLLYKKSNHQRFAITVRFPRQIDTKSMHHYPH